MALSLTRGGLTTIGSLDLELFCILEMCFRLFLNIILHTLGTVLTDRKAELVEQLVEHNFALLGRNWPYIDKLNILLFRLITGLFYRGKEKV